MMKVYLRLNFKKIVLFSILIFVCYLKFYTEILEVQMPKYGWDSVEHEVFLDLEQLRKGVKIGHVPRYSSKKLNYRIVFLSDNDSIFDLETKKKIYEALKYQKVNVLDGDLKVVDSDSIRQFSDYIYKAHLIDNKSGAMGRWKRHYLELLPNANIPPELYGVKISICLYRKHYDFLQ